MGARPLRAKSTKRASVILSPPPRQGPAFRLLRAAGRQPSSRLAPSERSSPAGPASPLISWLGASFWLNPLAT